MKLEDITEKDRDNIIQLTKLKSVMKYVGNGEIWDSDKVDRFIGYNLKEVGSKDRREYYYKITDNKFVGIIGVHPFLSFKGYYLSVMILPEEQRKGYYRKSIEKLKDKIKKEEIKTDRIKILVRTNNKRMVSLSEKNYYFNTERKIKGESFYEFFYFLRKYTYSINLLSKEENKIASEILEKRGNWEKYNFNNRKREIDFVYIYNINKYDKRFYNLRTLLKNVTLKDRRKITMKNLLFDELEKIKEADKYLIKNYNIDLENINMIMVKKLFKKHKVLIFKPVHGFKGYGIKIFENFDDFKNYLNSKNFKNFTDPILERKNSNIREWVLQEYIEDPLLIDGKKFHIRGYYLGYKNEKYLYDQGRIYPATKKYKKGDYYDTRIHDTHNPGENLVKYFPKDLKLNKKIKNNIQRQIEHLFHLVGKIDDYYFKCFEESKECYHLFGFDIMITEDYQVKMIEVNKNPGLPSVKIPFGKKLFEDEIKLIVDTTFPPKNKVDEDSGFKRVY